MRPSLWFLLLSLALVARAATDDLALADRYYKDEAWKAAADSYRRWLETGSDQPEAPRARLGMARALVKAGDPQSAVRVYEDFLLAHPSHEEVPEAGYELADLLVQTGNPSRAAELYHNFARLRQGDKARKALYLSAEASWSAGELESVKDRCREYGERFASGPDKPQCALLSAKVLGREGNWPDAVAELKPLAQSKGDSAFVRSARLALARALQQLGRNEESADAYRSMLVGALSQDSAGIVVEYANLLSSLGRHADLALWLGSRGWSELPPAQRLQKAEALYHQSRFAEAVVTLDSLGDANEEQRIRARFLRADVLVGMGERAEGIAILQSLGREGESRALVRAAQIYTTDGMVQQAIQSYYSALELFKDQDSRIPILLEVAHLYEVNLGRPGTARSVYEDFVRNFPGSPRAAEAAMGVARCWETEGSIDEAVRAYRRVAEDFPGSSLAVEAQSRLHYLSTFRLRNDGEAMEHMLLVLERGDYPEKPLQIARILEEDLKEYERALRSYQRFLKAPSDSASAALALFRSGRMRELLAEQAYYEKNPAMRASWLAEAKSDYQGLISSYPGCEWADDAEYRMLEMSPFSITAYEEFAARRTGSDVLPDALLRIGDYWSDLAASQGVDAAKRAALAYARILNEFRDSPLREPAMLGVSRSWYLAGQPDQALSTLKPLVSGASDRSIEAQAWLLQGEIQLSAKQYQQAVRSFKEVLFRFSSTIAAPRAQFRLGSAWVALGNATEAANAWQRYVEANPDGSDLFGAWTGMADLYAKRGDWLKAAQALRSFLEARPAATESPEAWERLGRMLEKLELKSEAADAYKRGVAAAKGGRDYLALDAAEMYLQLDQFDSAAVWYRKALASARDYRDSARAEGGLLPCLVMRGKRKEFTDALGRYKDRYGDEGEAMARAIYYDGCQLVESGDEAKARKRFDYLSDHYASTSWAGEGMYYLGGILFKKGDFKGALREFEGYLSKSVSGRSAPDAAFKAGTCHFQLKNLDLAAQYYRRAYSAEDASPQLRYRAAYNAATVYERLGQWAKAGGLYQIIEDRWPQFAGGSPILVSAGFAWFNAGEYEKARESLAQALRDTTMRERRAEAHYWYARSLDRLGLVDEAVGEYLKVGYLYRDEPMWGLTSLFEVGQVYERSGDLAKARRMYERIVEQDGRSGQLGSRAVKYLEELDKRAKPKE